MAVISRLPQGGGGSLAGLSGWETQSETPSCLMCQRAVMCNGEVHWFDTSKNHYIGVTATTASYTAPEMFYYVNVINGVMYCLSTTAIYKFSGGAYTKLATIPATSITYGKGVMCACTDGEYIYMICTGTTTTAGVYKYSIASNSFTHLTTSLPSTYTRGAILARLKGVLHCIGGDNYNEYHYTLDETAGTWTLSYLDFEIAPYGSYVIHEGILYVFYISYASDGAYTYDGSIWRPTANPPTSVYESSSYKVKLRLAASVPDGEGNLWLVGGENSSYLLNCKAKMIKYKEIGS